MESAGRGEREGRVEVRRASVARNCSGRVVGTEGTGWGGCGLVGEEGAEVVSGGGLSVVVVVVVEKGVRCSEVGMRGKAAVEKT